MKDISNKECHCSAFLYYALKSQSNQYYCNCQNTIKQKCVLQGILKSIIIPVEIMQNISINLAALQSSNFLNSWYLFEAEIKVLKNAENDK